MTTNNEFTVTVVWRDKLIQNETFREEKKARDFYADCLLMYPTSQVEFIPGKTSSK